MALDGDSTAPNSAVKNALQKLADLEKDLAAVELDACKSQIDISPIVPNRFQKLCFCDTAGMLLWHGAKQL